MKRDTRCPVCGGNDWIKRERIKPSKKKIIDIDIDLNTLESRPETEVVYVCKRDGCEKKVD